MLVLDRVTVSFGTCRCSRRLLTLHEGEAVAFVGRNGAQDHALRSSWASPRMAAASPSTATIWQPCRRTSGRAWASAMRRSRRLFSRFTVNSSCLPAQVAKLSAAETARSGVDRVYTILPELKEMAGRPAGSVSGGQGEMVALGQGADARHPAGAARRAVPRAWPRCWPTATPRRCAACAIPIRRWR